MLARHSSRIEIEGALLAEAVIACFLLVFAFTASSLLFDTSLRWERDSSTRLQAALIAERKMEEIRALCISNSGKNSFEYLINEIVKSASNPYDDAPGFGIKVEAIKNLHKPISDKGLVPTEGIHSPNSTLYTRPQNPNSKSRRPISDTPYSDVDKDEEGGDFQTNATYSSTPYSRSMAKSYRLIKVSVTQGAEKNSDVLANLCFIIGDPIPRPTKLDHDLNNPDNNDTLTIEPDGGSSTIKQSGTEFTMKVRDKNGRIIDDVSCRWFIGPNEFDVFALDSKGTRIRITPKTSANGWNPSFTNTSGPNLQLQATARYYTKEVTATIDCPVSW